ncbi:MAG: hypothetical protein IIX59_01745 [Alistipes sp.]|nr:hypothetical protein [Alistipes sp.]
MRRLTLLLTALTTILLCSAQSLKIKRAEFEQWKNSSLKSEKFGSLPYRIAHINDQSDSSPMLVVWLHGGHSCGEDNSTHIGDNYGAVARLSVYLQSNNRNAILVAPHLNEAMRNNTTAATVALCRLIDHLIVSQGIDPTRVYLIGASFGGMMATKVASARPDIPAAVEIIGTVPHIETPVPAQFAVCCVASDADNPRKFERTADQMYRLDSEGYKTLFAEYSGLSHRDICQRGIDTKTLDWLFSHSRNR